MASDLGLLGGCDRDIALVLPNNQFLTYREVRTSVLPWLRLLDGGSARKLVILFANNTVETILCYLSCLVTKNPVMIVDPGLDSAAVSHLVKAFRPDFLVWPSGVDPLRPLMGYKAKVDGRARSVIHMRIGRDSIEPDPRLALLLLTSGSTGKPRAVRLSADNLLNNAMSIVSALGLSDRDRAITSLPLSYCYGLSVLNSHMRCGASIIVSNLSPITRGFWRQFSNCAATTFASVPLTYHVLLRHFAEQWPESLRIATQSGYAMPTELTVEYAKLAESFHANFFSMYGQTEATARMSCVDVVQHPERVGSVGVAIPSGAFRIKSTDEGLESNWADGTGKVIYEGPNVMLGYADCRDDLALSDEMCGVLETGDLGFLDGGYLYLRGRLKRIVKVLGRRICLDEFEDALRTVGNVAVIEVDGKIVVFHTVDRSVVKNHARLVCGRFRIPYSYLRLVRVERIPHNSSAKIDYPELEALAVASTAL